MIFYFGKYKNQLIKDIFKKDKQYIKWLCEELILGLSAILYFKITNCYHLNKPLREPVKFFLSSSLS